MMVKYLLFLAMGGAIQGFVIALYCIFTRSGNHIARWLLAMLIFIICHITIINVLLTNGDLASVPHLSFTQSALALLVAPLYYLLVESITDKYFQLRFRMLLHVIPLVVFLFWTWSFFGLNGEQKQILITLMSINRTNLMESPFNKTIYYASLITQSLLYLSIMVKKWLSNKVFLKAATNRFIMALISFYSLTVFLVAFRFIFYYSLSSAILLPIFLSLGLYALSFWSIWAKEPILSFEYDHKKYSHSTLSSTSMKQIAERIMDAMVNDQMFLEKDLNVNKLANYLNIAPHTISQTINLELNETYSNLVNRLRVESVLNKLNSEDLSELTIEGIAFESGFKSKSSFYRAFKKHTGLSPSVYLNNR